MSTLTPNYELIVPEATDTLEQVRADYATNLNKIDGIGGGGSGGHTIVNPSGTDMPAESKLQFTGGVTVTDDSVNGKTVVDISGGGGNVYGAFIDPSRSLTSSIAFSNGTPINYTATKDCIVEIYNDSANVLEYCVDGLAVYFLATGSYTLPLPLKKGQTLTSVSANSYSGAYHAYGLTQGTNGIFAPVIYSDTERVIGVWRDNKPLYQITLDCGNLPNNALKQVNIGISNIENVVYCSGLAVNATNDVAPIPFIHRSNINYSISLSASPTFVELGCASNLFINYHAYVTLQYTKTTDVAGSGNWNTDGVPTVHYSTTEQVIGTWIDGKPLYQKSFRILALPSTAYTNTSYPHGISDFKELADIEIIVNTGSSYLKMDKQGYTGSGYAPQYSISLSGVTNSDVVLIVGTNRSTWSAVCTLKYTKTTD